MPNYSHWDLLEEIKLEEAVCLWCEIEPGDSPRARRARHPDSVPVERFLLAAIKKGELPLAGAGLLWQLSMRQKELPDDVGAFLQKADLRKLAEQKGLRPRFLFPEEEQRAKPSLTRGKPRKRGRVPWPTTPAIRKMIPIVETAIGGPATPTAMRAYFKKEGITKSTPWTFHEGFKDAYIENRDVLHWKDRRGNHHKMELASLGAHRRALEKA